MADRGFPGHGLGSRSGRIHYLSSSDASMPTPDTRLRSRLEAKITVEQNDSQMLFSCFRLTLCHHSRRTIRGWISTAYRFPRTDSLPPWHHLPSLSVAGPVFFIRLDHSLPDAPPPSPPPAHLPPARQRCSLLLLSEAVQDRVLLVGQTAHPSHAQAKNATLSRSSLSQNALLRPSCC